MDGSSGGGLCPGLPDNDGGMLVIEISGQLCCYKIGNIRMCPCLRPPVIPGPNACREMVAWGKARQVMLFFQILSRLVHFRHFYISFVLLSSSFLTYCLSSLM